MTSFEYARAAHRSLEEHCNRKAILDRVIALGDASVAAYLAELDREKVTRARTLDQIVREHAARSKRLAPSGPRIAPKRFSPLVAQPMPDEPRAVVADIASLLRQF